jgi:hypothetical protein
MRTGRNKVKEEEKKRKHKHQRGTKEDCKSWKINGEGKYNTRVWRPWMGELLVAKHDSYLGTSNNVKFKFMLHEFKLYLLPQDFIIVFQELLD